MTLIGFSVFKEKILSGEKRQTIRSLRKKPIKVGEKLYLYWHLRRKDCEKIGEAVCTETFTIHPYAVHPFYGIGDMPVIEAEALAQKDGFPSLLYLINFLIRTYGDDAFEQDYQVIRW